MAHEAELRSIPLDRLVKSSANVRKAPTDRAAQAELKANIAAHGLQQSLRVRPARKKGTYEVIAGGRRLAALQALAAEGVLPKDHPVPCLVSLARNAQEESLAENVAREAMHPADEFEAFAALVKDGQTVADIARRFGVSERHVNQRLKLGKAAAQLRSQDPTRRVETIAGVLSSLTARGAPPADGIRRTAQFRAWPVCRGRSL